MSESHDPEPRAADSDATDPSDGPDETELAAYDLDHDGTISIVERERARLGLVDARLEQIAEQGGVAGTLAEGAHHLLDKLDND